MRTRADLDHLVDDLNARGRGQPADLVQRLLTVSSLGPIQYADQDATLRHDVEFFSLRFCQLQSAIGWRGTLEDSLESRRGQSQPVEMFRGPGDWLRRCLSRVQLPRWLEKRGQAPPMSDFQSSIGGV